MTYEKEVLKLVMREVINDIIEQLVKKGVEYVANEIHKQDKGRNPPFWASNWRSRK